MHETGLVRELVRRIAHAVHEAGANGVSDVHVWMGALVPFSLEHFREHFEEEVRGTPVEGAALHIESSDDIDDTNAQHVILKRISLRVPPDEQDGP
ncbi:MULTISPECIES: hydrogenase/urease maturation nickel metallochaperone HypA [unclassified Burkholderia]|uniref:hydrogenase/urease maturation nickel metallochaperone HypA n=1 Tax=unclassified Burkholderia TaxID=2613784 RepID=UPI00075E632A|nr:MULTISPECIES: hydrogenase/urease maturation nickel metallochaperone HypA [unclassified Burkholderia]KUY61028.1 hydrogenase nickel incorporation protein HypA [Burkholderia sp. RF2-non_BP3]KUY85942.1 hydrogenase nickel incorporation protein HypA [Burkholderia sp. RF4-BP95]KUY92815.1 hydrogenase nickel incorporation protein HypA [Burkholderia sp. RF7-non_BP4]KUY95322.1 hydrogenase nickel incorporation protein HypA [Burkholderia sp. RF7-non_BP1]